MKKAFTLLVSFLLIFPLIECKADASMVTGMPKPFRHIWYDGKYKTKITKYHIYWAPNGGKYSTHISFKYVLKNNGKYTIDSTKLYEQTPYWLKGGKLYHGLKNNSNYPIKISHR